MIDGDIETIILKMTADQVRKLCDDHINKKLINIMGARYAITGIKVNHYYQYANVSVSVRRSEKGY